MIMKSALLICVLVFQGIALADVKCDDAIKMDQLKAKFLSLSYQDRVQREQGKDESSDAIDLISDFDKLAAKDPCRILVWKAYVNLAQAQSPFDGESGAAAIISQRMIKDKSLVAPYGSTTATFPERCRSQLLTSSVSNNQCIAKLGSRASNSAVENCESQNVFDFDKCVESDKPKK
jgi:hypothetical protein